MKLVTCEEFLKFNPCWLRKEGGAERIKAYFDRFGGSMSALDILNLYDVSEVDKLWAVLREEFIPAPILHEFACVCVDYALSLIETPDPRSIKAVEVKRAWLRGEAIDEELAAACDAALEAAYDAPSCVAYWAAAAKGAARAAARYAAQAAYDTACTAYEASEAATREAQVAYLIMALEEGV